MRNHTIDERRRREQAMYRMPMHKPKSRPTWMWIVAWGAVLGAGYLMLMG